MNNIYRSSLSSRSTSRQISWGDVSNIEDRIRRGPSANVLNLISYSIANFFCLYDQLSAISRAMEKHICEDSCGVRK